MIIAQAVSVTIYSLDLLAEIRVRNKWGLAKFDFGKLVQKRVSLISGMPPVFLLVCITA